MSSSPGALADRLPAAPALGVAARPRRGPLLTLWRSKTALFGLGILTLVSLAAIFAPLIAPYDPNEQTLEQRFRPPLGLARGEIVGSAEHLLGTDHLGRDI